jgi:hypothetical protein
MYAQDIVAVLTQCGWKPRLVTEKESHMSDTSFAQGVFIFTLSDGRSVTQAGTALWTAMVNASHEMGAQPFEGAPIHEILDKPKSGYPHFEPPITAVFVRVGLRQVSSQFLEMQRRDLLRQNEEWADKLKSVVSGGGKLLAPAIDGSTVEAKIGPDGKLISADPTKKLLDPDRDLTLILPGIMLRSKPPSGAP